MSYAATERYFENAQTDVRLLRARIRQGDFCSHTSGIANDFVQANVVILPQQYAKDFAAFCECNPKPCPLLAMSEAGDPMLPSMGRDIDIRTDVPQYRVWRGGELVSEPNDISALWSDDLVTFVIGCSFSVEWALAKEGISLRCIEPTSPHHRPVCSADRWWCRCARLVRGMHCAPTRSRRATPVSTAHRFTWAIRPLSVSLIYRGPITVMRLP